MMSVKSGDAMIPMSQKDKERGMCHVDSTEIGDNSSVEWLSMGDASELCEVQPQAALDDEVEEASCTANFFKSVPYAEPSVPIQLPPVLSDMYLSPPPGLGGPLEGDLQAPLTDLLAGLAQPSTTHTADLLAGLAPPFYHPHDHRLAGLAQPFYHPHPLQFPDFQTQCMLAAHSLEMRAALCRSAMKHMDDLPGRNIVKPEKKQKASKSSPEKTVKLKNQATLDFRAQKLRSLPEKLGELDQVQSLILSRNKLASLPSNIGQLQKLQLLNLSHNFELTALPDSFGLLRSLQTLLLHDNKLLKLPENFGELESLQLLYLQSNKLTCLPESFGKLKALQILDLRRNVLTHLPEDFGNLTRLQTLSLQYNRLSSLPKTFSNLHNLQELNLWSNPLPRSALPEVIGEIRELQPLKYGHPGSAQA
jgi:hypothetical protein